MADTTHVKGLDDLLRALGELPNRIQKNVMRSALRAGAVPIAEAARQHVPTHTGQLKASIRVDGGILKDGSPVAFVKAGARFTVYAIGKKGRKTKGKYKTVGADGSVKYHAAYYAAWIEFGTAKARAKPFMRPAFDGRQAAALQTIGDYVAQRLPVELEKLKVRR